MTMKELESCIEVYGKDIYNFCMHLTRDRELAEDLYQDTFLTAIQKQRQIEDTGNVKGYLLSVSIGLWKNAKRKLAWRNRIAPMGQLDDVKEHFLSYTEQDVVLVDEQKIIIRNAVQRLSEKYRIVILLFYMQELSQEEIANVLHIPVGTVKSRLYTAKKLLKSELEEYFHE